MKSGKIFLMIFLVFFSAIGLVVMQDLVSKENPSSNVEDFSPQVKNILIKVSDGIGTDSKG